LCRVELFTTSQNTRSANCRGIRIFRFPHFNSHQAYLQHGGVHGFMLSSVTSYHPAHVHQSVSFYFFSFRLFNSRNLAHAKNTHSKRHDTEHQQIKTTSRYL